MEGAVNSRGKTIVVVPAYNAARTLAGVVAGIPAGACDGIVVVDDASRDATAEVAESLEVLLVRHPVNRGYGGNLKTCYSTALDLGADYVVTVHGDDQYDPRIIPSAVRVLELGICDLVLGNRIRTRREALDGGMPRLKYFANRALTLVQNTISGQNLGEWHSGFRACRREVLERLPFAANSDDFVFDSQFLLQAVHGGFRVGDLPVPVRYFPEASSIGPLAAIKYSLETALVFSEWLAHRGGLRVSARFETGPSDQREEAPRALPIGDLPIVHGPPPRAGEDGACESASDSSSAATRS